MRCSRYCADTGVMLMLPNSAMATTPTRRNAHSNNCNPTTSSNHALKKARQSVAEAGSGA